MNKQLRKLPSVNEVLQNTELVDVIVEHGRELVTYAVRQAVEQARQEIATIGNCEPRKAGRSNPDHDKQLIEQIIDDTKAHVFKIAGNSLRPVINATGVVLHTNLGRAPIGEAVLSDALETLKGYTNLEFDLKSGKRGQRSTHVIELIKSSSVIIT